MAYPFLRFMFLYLVIFFLLSSKLQSGDRATVLCFVEFTDANCAVTAMEALQGKWTKNNYYLVLSAYFIIQFFN